MRRAGWIRGGLVLCVGVAGGCSNPDPANDGDGGGTSPVTSLSAGSSDQQFWLIWLLHLIISPAIYTLSLFGIALGVHLWHVHGGDPE